MVGYKVGEVSKRQRETLNVLVFMHVASSQSYQFPSVSLNFISLFLPLSLRIFSCHPPESFILTLGMAASCQLGLKSKCP